MNILKLAIVVGVIGLVYNTWSKSPGRGASQAATAASVNANGFLTMPPAAGGYGHEVLIVAPENCPADGAQRADELASQLAGRNIPVARSSRFGFNFVDAPPGAVDRILEVGRGDVPIVLVGGRIKSNPTLDEVLAEYAAIRL